MKFSTATLALTLTLAAQASAAGTAGSCKYIDSFGSDLCEHGNNDSWLPDFLEEFADQTACTGLSSTIGCKWDESAAKKCTQDSTTCNSKDETSCNSLAGKGCFWEETGACDPYDAMSCTAEGTEFYKCTHKAWDNLVQDLLITVDPLDPTTWTNIASLIEEFGLRMKNGCVSKYTECFFLTECGNPDLLVTNICEDAVTLICDELGTAADKCPTEWCKMGVTQGNSLIDIALEFADDFKIDTYFDAAKIQELRKTIEYIAGGSIKFDWIDFDKTTGKVTITIPEFTIISQAEFDDLVALLENMLSGSSKTAMTGGFAVKGVSVVAPAEIQLASSKTAWEEKRSEGGGGNGNGAVIGIAVGCVGLVAAVVGGVMYTKRNGAAKPATKQHGGVAMKGTAKRTSKGNNFIKGNNDASSYV